MYKREINSYELNSIFITAMINDKNNSLIFQYILNEQSSQI